MLVNYSDSRNVVINFPSVNVLFVQSCLLTHTSRAKTCIHAMCRDDSLCR